MQLSQQHALRCCTICTVATNAFIHGCTCFAVMVSFGTLPTVWKRINAAEADATPSLTATASRVGCLWALAWL